MFDRTIGKARVTRHRWMIADLGAPVGQSPGAAR